MRYRIAFPVLALVVAGGCAGVDTTAPQIQQAPCVDSLPSRAGTFAMLIGCQQGVKVASTVQNDNEVTSPRSGALHVTKECSEYTRLAGGFCTITSSNLPDIPVGTRVVYQLASGATTVNTDVVLDPPGPSASSAFGHVFLDLVGKQGHGEFSGGTGRFKRLSANVQISWLGGKNWAWEGTYSFSGNASGGE